MLVASLAACGSGSQHVPANAVAVVDGTPISTAEFNDFFSQAKAIAALQGVNVTPGTQQYTTMRNQIVAYLVQFTELKQQAPKEGVSVKQSEVNKYIENIVKTKFDGKMSKLLAELKKEGITLDTAKQEVYFNQLGQKLKTKVTSKASVTPAQEMDYYNANIATYNSPASTTRSVEYILFKCAVAPSTTCPAAKSRAEKAKAETVEQKLKNGASFEAMARQYSDDSSTAPLGGKYTVTKGQVVPAFEKATFSLKTGQTSGVVDATSTANQGFGWFIIKALHPTNTTKARTLTFKEVEPSIKQYLIGQSQDTLFQQWIADLAKQYQGKVSYQSGYAPPPTTTTGVTVPPPTTG